MANFLPGDAKTRKANINNKKKGTTLWGPTVGIRDPLKNQKNVELVAAERVGLGVKMELSLKTDKPAFNCLLRQYL